MAVQKEAWIFVLDLGQTMSIVAEGRDQTNLDWAMTYVWDKISYLVSLNRKTVNAGVIGLRTDDTDNIMGQDEAYSHIKVLYPITPCTMDHITNLRDVFVPSHQNKGDALSALIIAITMMMEFVKKLKYKQTIILVTDAMAPIDDDDMSEVIKQIKQNKIGLKILGIDFDEPEIGYKEESKSPQKAKNEKILHRLADSCDGICVNISIHISKMHIPVVKTPRPYKSYEGILALGTEGKALMETAASNICIEVERYFKTKQASPPSATTVVVRNDKVKAEEEDLGVESQTDFTEVIQVQSYFIDDPSFPGGRKYIMFDQLAKGYEYGRTTVFINKADENVTNLETFKSFTVIGFVAKENYDLVFGMGEVGMTIASRSEPKSIMGFASLVEGLQAAEAYAIGRLVPKDMKEPKLVLLIPDAEAQCLYDVPLPFAEDLRTYRFPPLDKALLTNTKHQLLPDDDLDEAMNNYVDSMDLSQVGVDDDGNPTDYISTDVNFNPLIHRINSAIQKRAVNQTSKIDLIPPVLSQYAKPFYELVYSASSSIKTLTKTANVKEIPPKAKYQKKRDVIRPLSGLDTDSLGVPEKSGPISKNNTVPDFKRALEASLSEDSKIQAAVQQMNTIISSLISESFSGNQDDRVIELIRVMREELLLLEKPAIYNDFLRDLKSRLLAKELGGDRRDLWFQMIKISRLGLIRNDQCEGSPVSVLEASEFYNSN